MRFCFATSLVLVALIASCSSSSPSSSDDGGTGGGGGGGGDDDAGGGGIEIEGGPIGPDAGDAAPATPRTCAEVSAQTGSTKDGDVLIDGDGAGPIAPFHVYCAGMSTATPREYVSLAAGTKNTTTYASGGYCTCPDFVRTFTKVRINPAKMTIDITDFTFSTANRDATCDTGKGNCQGPTHSYFGDPGSCVTNGDQSGSAQIDFTGTDFHIAPSVTYGAEGYMAAGSFTPSPDHKSATAKGGGACGYWSPAPVGNERLAVARD